MSTIHPSALVSEKAVLGADVEIGPFAIVEDDVEIGDGSVLEANAILRNGSRIGKSVTVGNFAVIGGLPQDLKFDPTLRTYARIGDGTRIRESVTVNRSTSEGGFTEVGANCFLMANAHVGHDSMVGDNVILGNGTLLAGHVSVGDFCFLGGNAGVHQFCRIGPGVMFGGMSVTTMDVAPYTMFAERNALFGLNLVGLRRRGVSKETIRKLQQLYRQVFSAAESVRTFAEAALAEGTIESAEERVFLEFFLGGKRGFAHPGRGS